MFLWLEYEFGLFFGNTVKDRGRVEGPVKLFSFLLLLLPFRESSSLLLLPPTHKKVVVGKEKEKRGSLSRGGLSFLHHIFPLYFRKIEKKCGEKENWGRKEVPW